MTIALFLTSTLGVELAGRPEAIAQVKGLIVTPGLWVLIPLLAVTGLSGRRLGGPHPTGRVAVKLARMKWVAANGLLVLVPCALTLEAWARRGAPLGGAFLALQGVELLAGLVNLTLIGLNFADGWRLSHPARSPVPV